MKKFIGNKSVFNCAILIFILVQLGGCKKDVIAPVSATNIKWTPYGLGPGISALAVSGAGIFAGSNGDVFVSTNNGSTWLTADNGLHNQKIAALAVIGGSLFMGTINGLSGTAIYASSDNGVSWQAANNGLPPFGVNGVTGFAAIGNRIFVGTGVGVFVSADNGSSWQTANNGLLPNGVSALAAGGNNIFAGIWRSGNGGGVYVSADKGSTWHAANNGLADTGEVYALGVSGTNIFASTSGNPNGQEGGGVYVSADNGGTWQAAKNGLPTSPVSSFAVSGNSIFAGSEGDGVYVSSNNGRSWQAANNGLGDLGISALAVYNGSIIAATNAGLFISPL